MSSVDIIDYGSTDDLGEIHKKTVKLESGLIEPPLQLEQYHTDDNKRQKLRRLDSENNMSTSALSTGQSGISVLDQEQSPVDDSSLCSTSPICAAPLCRQFWKAGNYNDVFTPKSSYKNGSTYLHIHPKFLHSNATSHKWAFGAIAELLDNAIDEIQNGATFVLIDKTINSRNGSPAFLIQDDGGGMDPDAMRRCLSFGFSDKKSSLAIGQYGNGFKTSSMRLGADAIVFSRNIVNSTLTQSIGLLSYTFLTQTGHNRIVVPMVDYEFNAITATFDPLHKENYATNLSVLLQWSPYSTEEELLKQFDDVGGHGTKVIIYNLWFTDEGTTELDFDSDPEDIRITRDVKSINNSKTALTENIVANRLRYSLRAYLSVLYLKLPETFCIMLRGRVVEYHNIATDLKYPEFILYKPYSIGTKEAQLVTTIGFLKEAPDVNVHGFNIYHKNRLILPFWPAVSYCDSRGRGVVGILEANFVEPTHNKQDFEKTSAFQKLENRLKEMTWDYWDHHCGFLGYTIMRKTPASSKSTSNFVHQHDLSKPGGTRRKPYFKSKKAKALGLLNNSPSGASLIDTDSNFGIQSFGSSNEFEEQEAVNVIQENKRLREQCLDYEKTLKELAVMVGSLKDELGEAQKVYSRLLVEAESLEKVKAENDHVVRA